MTELTAASTLVSIALCLAIAGCGSDSSPGSGEAGTAQASTTALAEAPSATAIDACSLLVTADISALLGTAVTGRSTSNIHDAYGCLWENPDNYESISLEVGSQGTAVNNTLSPPEPGFPEFGRPGPGGMRFLGYGQVEFPAGGRANSVQVAVLSMSADQADSAAVELARKVATQLSE
jgi:hypothetical protein